MAQIDQKYAIFRGIDYNTVEAARNLGASPFKVLLTVLTAYERKGHYLSVSKTKAKLQKQKINNPVANVLAHIYAYVLWIIYMTPVVMIVIFSFQTYSAIRMKKLDLSNWTLINYFGKEDYSYMTSRGTYKVREGSISGVFSNEATLGGIKLSFILSVVAAVLACVIVVVACNYIFKSKGKKRSIAMEYALLFPWLLLTTLICYSYRIYFNSLFTEYDMSATFASSYGTTYAMVIQAMCREEGLYGYNVNASGRRCASTVFIMVVSGIVLYLVYGVGARDLAERLEIKEKRRKRWGKAHIRFPARRRKR